jgi:hypothetical protein
MRFSFFELEIDLFFLIIFLGFRLQSYIVSCTRFPFAGIVSASQSIKFVWYLRPTL